MRQNLLIALSCSALLLAACQSTHSKSASTSADTQWRKTFDVNKSNLGIEGTNPYFSLTPGAVSTFKKDDEVLTITVLNETRTVDGITTRVVEEREVVGGKIKEVSRNFFAIDRTSGNVYYFGEEVDDYDANGAITHPGAWMSGVNGASFGLMMPGHPKVGDSFYQEIAPGVAMDRFEIISIDETMTTPAGKFNHCIHVRETTPLEKDVGYKIYAHGTGLIKDGAALLTSHKLK